MIIFAFRAKIDFLCDRVKYVVIKDQGLKKILCCLYDYNQLMKALLSTMQYNVSN